MKTILITGASSGIGRATALALDGPDTQFILCGRRREALEAVQKQLTAPSHLLTFDVRFPQDVDNAFNSLPKNYQVIDILINNAGNAHGLGPLDQNDPEDWEQMLDGNVKGILYVSRHVIPGMKKRGCGHIVNISSIAGKETYPNGVVYCASKHAVESISKGMRLELTEFGIRVSNVAPGAVETNFSKVRFRGDEERAAAVYDGYQPLQPEDIAAMIRYIVQAPPHVCVSDVTIYPTAQSEPRTIYRK